MNMDTLADNLTKNESTRKIIAEAIKDYSNSDTTADTELLKIYCLAKLVDKLDDITERLDYIDGEIGALQQ